MERFLDRSYNQQAGLMLIVCLLGNITSLESQWVCNVSFPPKKIYTAAFCKIVENEIKKFQTESIALNRDVLSLIYTSVFYWL